jgi:catechol 2,3-dioxygenase-like lactoylglutathione lyase family enzyme
MERPTLGSVLLGTADPDRLRAWYCAVLAPDHQGEGFIDFGGTELLIDGRSDLRPRNTEPGRTILNFHVDDARAMEERLVALDAIWIRELQVTDSGHLIGTVLDPDGNYVQIIQAPARSPGRTADPA